MNASNAYALTLYVLMLFLLLKLNCTDKRTKVEKQVKNVYFSMLLALLLIFIHILFSLSHTNVACEGGKVAQNARKKHS